MHEFDTNFAEGHSVVIEILPVSCFLQFLVTADCNYFGQMAKNPNGFMQKIIEIKSLYNSINVFFILHFAFF